jgi:hypothetical protein
MVNKYLEEEYEDNFTYITNKDISRLTITGFNKNSNIKAQGYRNFYNLTWVDIVKKFNKYDDLFKYIVDEYMTYCNIAKKQNIQSFAKEHEWITYRLLESIGIDNIRNACEIKKLRYEDEEYKGNFDNIKYKIGRVPLFNDFNNLTEISLNSYANKYKLKEKVYDEVVKMFTTELEYKDYLFAKGEHKTKVGKITGALSLTLTFDDLENEFRRVFDNFYNEYEIYPSRRLFNKFSKHDDSVYRNRFNLSWTDICKQYGYIVKPKNIAETYVLKSISQILNLEYEPQKSWKWLIGIGGKNMFCDGYFRDIDLVVEFDGFQHRIPIAKYGGEEKLKRTQQNDSLKNELLKQHNIKLIRIDSRYNWTNKNYLKEILIKNNIILPTAS